MVSSSVYGEEAVEPNVWLSPVVHLQTYCFHLMQHRCFHITQDFSSLLYQAVQTLILSYYII